MSGAGRPAHDDPLAAPAVQAASSSGVARPPGADQQFRRRKLAVSGLVLAGVLACTLLLGAALLRPSGVRVPTALLGRGAPSLTGTTLDGEQFDLTRLRGSVVLVNVWASWCAPCRDELPLLVEAQRRWADRGVQVVGVDFRDGPVAARALLIEVGAAHLPSVSDLDGRQAVTWGIRGVPETFLVDRSGTVRAVCVGPISEQWLAEQVEPLL